MSKIVRIGVTGIRYPAGSLHRSRWGSDEEACVVEIEDADGRRGSAIARCHVGRSAAALREEIEVLAHLVISVDLEDRADIEAVFDRTLHVHLAQYVSVFAVSVLDVALWDLLGILRELPVRALIDPEAAARTAVAAYASLPHVHAVDQAIRVAQDTLSAGFETAKLHSSGDLDLDERIVTALRAEFGSQAGLAFDAARAFEREQALRLAHALHDSGYRWFEEPFGPYADADISWLRERVPIPLAGFETAPGGPDGARWAIERGAVDLLLVDCYWKAGITGALRVVDAADTAGQRLLLHHGASVAMNLANMQVAAARPSVGAVEILAPYGEYDVAARLPALLPGTGILLPEGPGLGLELDADFLASHAIDTARVG